MMNVRHMTCAVTLAGLALLATGCATTSTAANNGPTQVQAAANPDPQALAKANEFITTAGAAEQARQVAIQDCMAEAGFQWKAPQSDVKLIEDLIPLKPLTLEQARTRGYTAPDQNQSSEANTAQTQAETLAFSGPADAPKVSVDILGMKPSVSSAGCLAQSYTAVYGSIENGMMATGVSVNAVLPSINAAMADPSIAGANAEWATCMASSGQPGLTTPDLAWDRARQNSQDAATIAVADAKCRESINYEDTRRSALNKYLTTFLTSNEAIITEIQDIRIKAAGNAQKILSGL